MSSFLQFFPNSNQQNIGGGSVPVEILGLAGGGGGGTGCCAWTPAASVCYCNLGGGGGGGGGVLHAFNYYVEPGATYPITIGAGGAGGVSPSPTLAIEDVGDPGGATIFNNSVCVLRVEGGGGGGAALTCCCVIGDPTACLVTSRGPWPGPAWANTCGQPGGNGGGSGANAIFNNPSYCYDSGGNVCRLDTCTPSPTRVTLDSMECQIGKGLYNRRPYCSERRNNQFEGFGVCCAAPNCALFTCFASRSVDNVITEGYAVTCPWGVIAGFPGSNSMTLNEYSSPTPTGACSRFCAFGGCGGKGGGNAVVTSYYMGCCATCSPCTPGSAISFSTPGGPFDIAGNSCAWYNSSITGSNYEFGCVRGSGGVGGKNNSNASPSPSCLTGGVASGGSGCAGVLIIKYPSAYGAAPSFPGGSDISPSTPGYYTYCFTSSGSITLP